MAGGGHRLFLPQRPYPERRGHLWRYSADDGEEVAAVVMHCPCAAGGLLADVSGRPHAAGCGRVAGAGHGDGAGAVAHRQRCGAQAAGHGLAFAGAAGGVRRICGLFVCVSLPHRCGCGQPHPRGGKRLEADGRHRRHADRLVGGREVHPL